MTFVKTRLIKFYLISAVNYIDRIAIIFSINEDQFAVMIHVGIMNDLSTIIIIIKLSLS